MLRFRKLLRSMAEMSDFYGSGLSFGAPESSGGPAFTQDGPRAPDGPVMEGPQPNTPPQTAADEGPQETFGSKLKSILPGPKYEQPDPAMSALDQSASVLEQRVKRASQIATNPLAQIFAPEQVQAARQFVPQAAEALQKIKSQQSAIQSGRIQAESLGLKPGEVSDNASNEDRMTVAISKALKGDMRAFSGIQAWDPTRAAAIAPQVHEVVAANLDKAQLAFDSLAGMQNQGQYAAKLQQLRNDGTLTGLEQLGLKVPATFGEFQTSKALEGKALREARIGIETTRQQLEQRNTYVPMEEKEAKTYGGRLTTPYGDQVNNGTWSRNGASGTRGFVVNGLAVPEDLGRGGTLGSAEQRKQIGEEFKQAVPKEELEKHRAFNRTYELATRDAKGKPLPDGKINTNPNVQQGIAEGLASMLRGGSGGANVGLLKIELMKRGWAQSAIDGLVSNYAGTVNTLFKNADKPYLSEQTQKQIRDVMDVLQTYNTQEIGDRAKDIARRAGALGFDVSALGLGKNETKGAIADALEEGRQAQIERMRQNFQAIGGGDGVLQLGAQRPGAVAAPLPPGTQNANQLPGAQPLQTPVQQATNQPPAPNAPPTASPPNGGAQTPPPAPNPPAGGGAPTTIAGQQITLPPGLRPEYVTKMQRIESGNERDPWKAGAKGSSASGAFQFINSTWKDNKPAGAPARAADATPQQQAEALATLTEKNTQTLQRNGLPVNDTSLYIAHNLGAGGASQLMRANPNADAREIVGEDAARNNPLFFRGRPTVAQVLQRYAEAVNAPDDEGGPKPRPGAGGATAETGQNFRQRQRATREAARDGGDGPDLSGARRTGAQLREEWRDAAADNAPAVLSTAGAVGGSLLAGPAGGVGGGAAGGAAGQTFKNWLKGEDLSKDVVKEGLIGGVLGVASAARPVAATAGRVVGSAAVNAGAKIAEQGEVTPDAVDEALKGGAAALGGEAFGRALGMVGHKVYSMFTPEARVAVQKAAGEYATAVKALETEPSRLPAVGGAAGGLNPKWEAAERAKAQSEKVLKDAGLNPEEAAYAHRVSSEGVPKQEAQVAKPAELERENIGQGYRQLEREVADRGVGAPKPAPKLADGPISVADKSKMSPTLKNTAERTEMAITAPAKDWQEKWTQLKDTRSSLLEMERDALNSTSPHKSSIAKDYRALADSVRVQQAKAAEYVFGKTEGAAVMKRLETLDTRYARLMDATHDMDLVKAAKLTGQRGREIDAKFKAFAVGDPDALRAWNAMRGVKGDAYEATVPWTVAAEGIPVVGKLVKVGKLAGMLREWSQERAAGSPVKFSDIVKATGDDTHKHVRDIFGSAGARTATQGDLSAIAP